MINAVHTVLYARDAEKARAFFRDVLQLRSVDAGHGWLIFALPPAELGIHPAEGDERQELHLMCDDIVATMADLKRKGVEFTQPVREESFGHVTRIRVPGGGELGLYQPKHASPLEL